MNDSFNDDVITTSIKFSSTELINETSYDQWSTVTICEDAVCKRIKTPKDYNGFLVRYETGARTVRHENHNEYEILDIRVGSIRNTITNEVYHEGDTIMFTKGEEHELICEEEAYVYCVMSKKQRQLG